MYRNYCSLLVCMNKTTSNTNYSAGILLYRTKNNKKEFLLGKDVKYNSWSDFGGKNDSGDNKNPLNTAVREFYEETCGVIVNTYDMLNIINEKCNRIQCLSYKKKLYFMYLVEYNTEMDLESMFHNQYVFLDKTDVCAKFKEKDEIKWFDIDTIVNNKSIFRGVFFNSFTNNLEEICRVTI